jgi:hypothetical protein
MSTRGTELKEIGIPSDRAIVLALAGEAWSEFNTCPRPWFAVDLAKVLEGAFEAQALDADVLTDLERAADAADAPRVRVGGAARRSMYRRRRLGARRHGTGRGDRGDGGGPVVVRGRGRDAGGDGRHVTNPGPWAVVGWVVCPDRVGECTRHCVLIRYGGSSPSPGRRSWPAGRRYRGRSRQSARAYGRRGHQSSGYSIR